MQGQDQGALLARARQGDVDAFALLFEALRPTVYAVACRLVGANDAEDVVMETYLKAWRAIPQFTGRAALSTWLYRIAHNCALDALRARARQPLVSAPRQDDEPAATSDWPDTTQRLPSDAIAGAETDALIRQALDQLPVEHRATLLLRFADGLSYAEIAAATDVALGTVMSRIFNGRRKLQRILRALELSPERGGREP